MVTEILHFKSGYNLKTDKSFQHPLKSNSLNHHNNLTLGCLTSGKCTYPFENLHSSINACWVTFSVRHLPEEKNKCTVFILGPSQLTLK